MDKIEASAKILNLKNKTETADLNEYQIAGSYDVVISVATLHFLDEPHAKIPCKKQYKNDEEEY